MLVMAISKISFDKVYGVVMTTADGEEYGLHHVTNIGAAPNWALTQTMPTMLR